MKLKMLLRKDVEIMMVKRLSFAVSSNLPIRTTVNSRYLEVVGTIFYKFKLPEVQINLHFG